MKLEANKRDEVIAISLEYLGVKRSKNFTCITFIESVYERVNINLPMISTFVPPPEEFNISKQDLDNWKHGYIIFLKKIGYRGDATWTHVGITLPEDKIIHCSRYFGWEVSITSKDDIFDFYHYVPS